MIIALYIYIAGAILFACGFAWVARDYPRNVVELLPYVAACLIVGTFWPMYVVTACVVLCINLLLP